MKTQVVYALIASPNNLFLEEFWASVFSLRLYEKEREVRVCCDSGTAIYIEQYDDLMKLLTEIVIVEVPEDYDSKKRSREIKTTIRNNIKGPFIFVDTDTIFAGSIDYFDSLQCDIAAALEHHLSLNDTPYKDFISNRMNIIFGLDIANYKSEWFNSGVLYVADSKKAHQFYQKWHDNWIYSTFKRNCSQDEPALMKANIDMEYVINELPGQYDCQPCMSIRYLSDAKIIHFMHMFFPKNQSFNPFMDKSIYKDIKINGITNDIISSIQNVKGCYSTPTTIVGWETMQFLSSPSGRILETVYNEGGIALWFMINLSKLLYWINKISKK